MSHLLSTIERVLERFPEIELAVAFGSVVRGTPRFESDLDVAVAGPKSIHSRTRKEIMEALAEETGRAVDLIDLARVSGPILGNILTRGKVLRNRRPALYAKLLRRLWYWEADMAPYWRRILTERRERFIHGPGID